MTPASLRRLTAAVVLLAMSAQAQTPPPRAFEFLDYECEDGRLSSITVRVLPNQVARVVEIQIKTELCLRGS